MAIDVAANGSGTVTARIGLDRDAQARVGDLRLIRYEDLSAGGWAVKPVPQPDANGWVWLEASKPFDDEGDVQAILNEIGGEDGIFKGFTLEVSDGFATTSYEILGKLDGSEGVEQFSDPEVTKVLEGLPLGRTPEELAAELGEGTTKATVELRVSMPGKPSIRDSAGTVKDGQLVWSTEIGATKLVEVNGTSEVEDSTPRLLLEIGAALVGVAAISLLVAWRRTRRLRRLRRLRRPT